MIGTRFGPYEITAKLGEGGMGEVYRATDTKLDRQVAIKVFPSGFTQDAERLARFEREAKILAQRADQRLADGARGRYRRHWSRGGGASRAPESATA